MAAAFAAASAFATKYAGAIALGGAGLSAYTGYQQGQMQAISMRLQASQAQLQGRQNALNYSRQGLQALQRQAQLAATVRARASAGGVDPFTGSPLTVQQLDMMKAQNEAQIAEENAATAVYGGLAQSQSLQAAATGAEFIGAMSAVGSAVRGVAAYGDLRTPTRQAAAPVRDAVPVAVG
jgi:hypothetical protein